MSNAAEYYDPMAKDYHLLFADWQALVRQEGEVLDRIIREHMAGAITVLDCACGIGAQAIGLSLRGYRVHGTDLSPASVDRAISEAHSAGSSATFGVADLRALRSDVSDSFDVVIACDNALPHCLTDEELGLALQQIRECLCPGGLFLSSMRDYDALANARPEFVDPHIYREVDPLRIVFQFWDWHSHLPRYTVHQFILLRAGESWETRHFEGEYRALKRDDLTRALLNCGFVDVHWLMPEESGYYQPLVAARRAGAS